VGVGLSPVRVCGYLVAFSQVSSNFIPDVGRNLAFRGCSSMMELASSIIWYVHIDVPRRYISSDSSLNFQIQPVTLDRSTLDGSPLSPPLPPHIQPQYYAAIIAAEAIGNSGNTKVIELNIADSRISGYVFYQGDKLTKAILINSLAFFTTTTTARPSTHVSLIFASGTVSSKMSVKRLFVPYVHFLRVFS
jgi:Glycosyl hydrolase family 79 C-terminal beta domain